MEICGDPGEPFLMSDFRNSNLAFLSASLTSQAATIRTYTFKKQESRIKKNNDKQKGRRKIRIDKRRGRITTIEE